MNTPKIRLVSSCDRDHNSCVDDNALYKLAGEAGKALRSRNSLIATAESCTGGWVAKVFTDIPGSSEWFERGFVTYSNRAKAEQLGVNPELINQYGAVSMQVVEAMVEGALKYSGADIALAVSGIAGPDGGSISKPVGTVWFAWARRNADIVQSERVLFAGSREQIRRAAVAKALAGVLMLCMQ